MFYSCIIPATTIQNGNGEGSVASDGPEIGTIVGAVIGVLLSLVLGVTIAVAAAVYLVRRRKTGEKYSLGNGDTGLGKYQQCTHMNIIYWEFFCFLVTLCN